MDEKNIEENNEILLGRNKAFYHRKAIKYLHNFFANQPNTINKLLNSTLPIKQPKHIEINNSFVSQSPPKKLPNHSKSNSLAKLLTISNNPKRAPIRPSSSTLSSKSLGFKMKEVQERKNIINFNRRRTKITLLEEPLQFTEASPTSVLPEGKTLTQQALNFVIKELTRPDRDIEKLYHVTKKLKFFAQYNENIVKMLLQPSEYEFYAKGDFIFREGDDGRHIWVILSGSVSVQKETDETTSVPWIINSRYDGEVIGEYAIVRGSVNIEAAKRSATCFAGETCHMLKISSDDYIHAVQSHIDTEGSILKFLRELKALEKIPSIDLKLLSNTISQQYYTLNQVILNAGEVPKGMYIIYNGRVRISYPTKIPKINYIKQKVFYTESMKDLYLPRGMYFGQRILMGDKTPCSYKITSESAETILLMITHHVFFLLYNPYRDETLQYLAETPQYDIKVPVPLRFE
ncbi:unnamed protein product [Blepharisma stoltei]|uniref:Cyclic nucleotide-binding domain-containing protein n=1 Tax=Blepharisma stoltei TaxID=1481888 RepID=A0AAU9JHT6_9CILI|nr:unnamed protein product [Blepharisma stoltei]